MSDLSENPVPADVVVERDLECATRDGTVLRADVYRPADRGPFPTLVCRTPYDKTIGRYVDMAAPLAGAGYCVVVQDIRGRLRSEGEFRWMFGPTTDDTEDGHDTVEWAAALPWSDGRVGAFGHSYDGWAVWKMLADPPPSLETAFISGITRNLRALTFGLFETGRRLEWTYTLANTDRRLPGTDEPLPRSEVARRWHEVERGKYLWQLPLGDLPWEPFGDLAEKLMAYLRSAEEDPWDFGPLYSKVSIPIMQMTGWWDRLAGTVENHAGIVDSGSSALRDQHRLIVGPWGHDPTELTGRLGPIDYGEPADRTYAGLARRWFDLHLKDVDDGIGGEEPVQLFVLGENRWRGFGEWPPEATEEAELFLSSAGSANTVHGDGALGVPDGPDGILGERADLRTPKRRTGSDYDTYEYDPRDPLMSLMRADSQMVPVDQAPHDRRQDVLVYDTSDLEEPLTLLGVPSVILWAATDGPDTDWSVSLAVVGTDGLAVNLTYGIVRAQYRHSADDPQPLLSGETYEYRIPLNPVGIRLAPGERLRLYVSSSDFPNFDRNHNTGKSFWDDSELRVASQTVFHSPDRPSRLVVPVETA